MGSRNRLGAVLHVSKSSGNLILKMSRDAKIGDAVTDSKGKRIGVVFDIFGPVETPYASVKTGRKDSERFIGKDLFLRGGKR